MSRFFTSFSLLYLVSLVSGLHAQTAVDSLKKSDSLFLRIVIPDRDTVLTPFARHRIAASTLPTAKAFVNDKETKVYPSGAFVGLLPLIIGPNPLHILVISETGDSLFRDFVFLRNEPIRNKVWQSLANVRQGCHIMTTYMTRGCTG